MEEERAKKIFVCAEEERRKNIYINPKKKEEKRKKMSGETKLKACRKCHIEKFEEEFTRQKYESKKKGIYWIYNGECEKCVLVDKKIRYHSDEKKRKKYRKAAKERKRAMAEEK